MGRQKARPDPKIATEAIGRPPLYSLNILQYQHECLFLCATVVLYNVAPIVTAFD
jgi:hypothetical protein